MRTRDIMLMTFLFVLCFFISEFFVSRFVVAGPVIRFVLRIALLIQYTVLIKYLFEYFERADEEISGDTEPSGLSEVKDKTAIQTIHHEENGRKNDEH